VKVLGSKNANCSDANVPCGRLLLVNTSFESNVASKFGKALVVTKPTGVLVSCGKILTYNDRDFIGIKAMRREKQNGRLKIIDPSNLCASWHGNRGSNSASNNVIGTFGHKLNIKIDSSYGYQLLSDGKSGLVLLNVSSG